MTDLLDHNRSGQHYLVAYTFQTPSTSPVVCQEVTDDVIRLIDELEENDDGTYIVINVLTIPSTVANRWDGKLQGM